MEVGFRDVALVIQGLATIIIGIIMKFFHSELKQRDIKIDHIDKRLKEVEVNYNTKFNKVYDKQDNMAEILGDIRMNVAEIKQLQKDQKEFCQYIQDQKKK